MKNKKGFTLVELLAVIAILAILVLIALPNVVKIFNEAKKTTLETSAKMIASGAKFAVFPSVYLKSNVNLIGTGDNLGSINNPYTLSID